jgi:DNA-binding NarL/FixJ family response regulator
MTRILLVDSNEVVRCGLKVLLRSLRDVGICGESKDGLDAIQKSHELKPDIIITDFRLPSANSVIVTRRVLRRHPEQKILVFASIESRSAIRALLIAGVQGLVLRNDPAEEVLFAIESLRNNRTYFTSDVEDAIITEFLRPESATPELDRRQALTLREQEVAQLLAEGKVTKEIATILGMSFKTAATHRSNVMRKLEAHNQAQMTLKAIATGIIDVPVLRLGPQVIEGGRAFAKHESFARAAA